MEDDWDLHAVVRGCAATATTTSAVTTTAQILTPAQQESSSFPTCSFRDVFELHDLYKPFFSKPQQERPLILPSPQSLPVSSPHSVLGRLQDLSAQQQQQKMQMMKQLPQQKQQSFSVGFGSKASVSHNPGPRSKRRKNHMKRVCHVPADSLSSDRWSWRKYGQKPIKGSPYPRGYYRCSTSKGCMARKQVERNRSDPGVFIVTYTSEHNHPMPTHRNSLAGSSRQKPLENPNSEDSNKPSCSPEMSEAASLSPVPEKLESSRDDLAELEDEDDGFSISKMPLDDDFFSGLEDFTVPDAGYCVSGHFPASLQFPWLLNVATTTAGGG